MIATVVAYYFLPKSFLLKMLPTGKSDLVTEVAEWMMRMVGSMVSVQVRKTILYLSFNESRVLLD